MVRHTGSRRGNGEEHESARFDPYSQSSLISSWRWHENWSDYWKVEKRKIDQKTVNNSSKGLHFGFGKKTNSGSRIYNKHLEKANFHIISSLPSGTAMFATTSNGTDTSIFKWQWWRQPRRFFDITVDAVTFRTLTHYSYVKCLETNSAELIKKFLVRLASL